MGVAGWNFREDQVAHPAQHRVVLTGHFVPATIVLVQVLQFGAQNGRLHRVETAVPAKLGMEVFLRGAVVSQSFQFCLQVQIIRRHRPGIAAGAEVLARIETEATQVAHRTCTLAVSGAAVGLGGVLDDSKVVDCGDSRDCRHLHHAPVQVNRHNGFRSRPDGGGKLSRIHKEISLVYVDQHRLGPRLNHTQRRGDKRVRRQDDLVTRFDIHRATTEVESVRAARHAHAVLHPAIRGEGVFEFTYLIAQDEVALVKHRLDPGADLPPQLLALYAQIQKRNSQLSLNGNRRVSWHLDSLGGRLNGHIAACRLPVTGRQGCIMVKLGVIGSGRWGPNQVRVFRSLPDTTVAMVADLDQQRLRPLVASYPDIQFTQDPSQVLESNAIDAVVICTPTQTHHELVRASLEAGKHVLCEKPLCVDPREGNELVALAGEKGRVLMIGHVFLFNSGIIKLKEILARETLGNIRYVTATRTNLGPVRRDVNVVFDLAAHDVSIFNFLLGSRPIEVSAVGMSFLHQPVEDVSFASLMYPNGVLANVQVSWLDPKKVRQMTIVGSEKMATWDDLSPLGPIAVYDKGFIKERKTYSNFGEFQLLARDGDITIPKVKMEEPLRAQAQHFLASIHHGTPCASDGRMGVEVVQVLDAMNRSVQNGGRPAEVNYSCREALVSPS